MRQPPYYPAVSLATHVFHTIFVHIHIHWLVDLDIIQQGALMEMSPTLPSYQEYVRTVVLISSCRISFMTVIVACGDVVLSLQMGPEIARIQQTNRLSHPPLAT